MATTIATIFMKQSKGYFLITSTALTGNEPPFTLKFFAQLCRELGVKAVATAVYHPQASVQFERFDVNIISILRQYVAEYQKNYDLFILPCCMRTKYRSTKPQDDPIQAAD